MRSPERPAQRRAFGALLGKEWRELLAGRAFWVLLVLLSPLVGYSYVQAVALYAEASRPAAELPEVARNLLPLDGILVPTFGGLYLATTFLWPFVAIRAIGREKETGSLKLLLQLPWSTPTLLAAKLAVLGAGWLLILAPCLSAVALWSWAGGHIGLIELANLVLGHFLYGAVITGIALAAAAFTESSATAAILAIAFTLGFWVLDFAAAGETGLLKTLSSLSLTTLLRDFERGVFSLAAALAALLAATTLTAVAGVWLDLRTGLRSKSALTLVTALVAVAAAAGVSQLRVFGDATENRRNSFAPADAATLSSLDKRLTILVHLAPEDPRYVDFERNILSKLHRTVPDVRVELASESRSGLFEGASESYGTVFYRYDGKQVESRSTGTGEVLPLIYALAGVERKPLGEPPPYPGYPLVAETRTAELWFYGLLPLLVVALWGFSRSVGRYALRRAVRLFSTDADAERNSKQQKGDS